MLTDTSTASRLQARLPGCPPFQDLGLASSAFCRWLDTANELVLVLRHRAQLGRALLPSASAFHASLQPQPLNQPDVCSSTSLPACCNCAASAKRAGCAGGSGSSRSNPCFFLFIQAAVSWTHPTLSTPSVFKTSVRAGGGGQDSPMAGHYSYRQWR